MKSFVTFFKENPFLNALKTTRLRTIYSLFSFTILFLFNSTLEAQNYCASKATTATYMGINRVSFNSINNTSGNNNGYKDFTNLSTNVEKGKSYNITIDRYKAHSTSYGVDVAVWMDFNKDSDFNDGGERVFFTKNTTQDKFTGTITIPNNASSTSIRMRVSLFYYYYSTSNGKDIDPCLNYSHGEVEDYTINIQGGDTMAPTAPTSLSSSAITQTSVQLNWQQSGDNVGVTGYNIYRNNSAHP